MRIVAFFGVLIREVLAFDAFSTHSFLKVELQLGEGLTEHIVQSLTPCSDTPVLLPDLNHLVLCMEPIHSQKRDGWHRILDMICARRDARLLSIIEVQFNNRSSIELKERMEADIRALAAETLEIRVEERGRPGGGHWSLWGLPRKLQNERHIYIRKTWEELTTIWQAALLMTIYSHRAGVERSPQQIFNQQLSCTSNLSPCSPS